MSASGRSRRLSCCSWRLCTCSGACDLTRTQKHKQWRWRRRRNLPPRLLQVLPRGDSPRGPVAQGAAQSLPRFLEANARWRVEQGSCYQRDGGRRPTHHLRGGPGSTGSRPRCSVQQLELQSLCRRVAVNLNPFASLTQDVAVSALSPPYVYAINAKQSFLSKGVVWHAEGEITGTGGRTESL